MTSSPYITGLAAQDHRRHLTDRASHDRLVREARSTPKSANRTFRPTRFTVRVAGWFQTTPRTA